MEKEKIEIIKKIAVSFSSAKVIWALGGSMMLKLRGLEIKCHDIDIVVNAASADFADKCLLELGEKMPNRNRGNYTTDVFNEYIIDGCDVDLMVNASIKNADYVLNVEKNDVLDIIYLDNIAIPLHSIEKWKDFYTLIDRPDKVLLIDELLKSQ